MTYLGDYLAAFGVDGVDKLFEAGDIAVVIYAQLVCRVEAERVVYAYVLGGNHAEAALCAFDIMADTGVVDVAAFGVAQTHGGHERTVADFNAADFSRLEKTRAITG